MPLINDLGQPIGDAVPSWTERPRPPRAPMQGRRVRLEPLDASRHAADLYKAYSADAEGRLWTYVPDDPPKSAEEFAGRIAARAAQSDLVVQAIIVSDGRAKGYAAYMRIDPAMGSVEVGHVLFSPSLQRTPGATEAMYLMMRRAFEDLGYRRYEWKCDALNAPSVAAAKRLGFTYEGTFRQAVVHKARNRDTAWFSITDAEWPVVKEALEAWLAPENFDAAGRQRRRLDDLRAEALAAKRV